MFFRFFGVKKKMLCFGKGKKKLCSSDSPFKSLRSRKIADGLGRVDGRGGRIYFAVANAHLWAKQGGFSRRGEDGFARLRARHGEFGRVDGRGGRIRLHFHSL